MNRPIASRLARQWESPPTWLLAFGLAVWLQARFLPLAPPGPAARMSGWVLIAAGLVLVTLAVAAFRRERTTILPRETPTRLLSSGVYALSRNPIYLADALVLAGWALLHDRAALVLVPLFMIVIERRFIRGEEEGLRAAFGEAFSDYAARVRRWL
ncbi:MAG: methyltransferase family protein [Pseudomonadota bacterium]